MDLLEQEMQRCTALHNEGRVIFPMVRVMRMSKLIPNWMLVHSVSSLQAISDSEEG
jgi:hypothetical protein